MTVQQRNLKFSPICVDNQKQTTYIDQFNRHQKIINPSTSKYTKNKHLKQPLLLSELLQLVYVQAMVMHLPKSADVVKHDPLMVIYQPS
jgi:hypothetical protein